MMADTATGDTRNMRTLKYTIEVEGPDGERDQIRGIQFTDLGEPGAPVQPGHARQSGGLYYHGQEKFYGRMSLLVHAFDVLTTRAGLAGYRPLSLTLEPNPLHQIDAAVTVPVKLLSPGYLLFALEDALYSAGVTVHQVGKMAELYVSDQGKVTAAEAADDGTMGTVTPAAEYAAAVNDPGTSDGTFRELLLKLAEHHAQMADMIMSQAG